MIDCQVVYTNGNTARYICVQVAQFLESGRTEFAFNNGMILSVLTSEIEKLVQLPVQVVEDEQVDDGAEQPGLFEDDEGEGLTD